MGLLSGKVAVITGAARGMGRSHALRLAAEGADVALIDACSPFSTTTYPAASKADLVRTAEDVAARGGRARHFIVDIRESGGLSSAIDEVFDDWGRLDVVVANAGISSYAPLLELTAEQWDEMVSVNLTGTFHTLQATIPRMLDAGNGGSIVIVGSTASIRGTPYLAHYVATKHGVVGLMRSVAIEFSEAGIRANVVCPGSVETAMGTDPTLDELANDPTRAPLFLGSFRPLMSPGTMAPENISDSVLFLASDLSSGITGQLLAIDRGVTAW